MEVKSFQYESIIYNTETALGFDPSLTNLTFKDKEIYR